jgi:hypothetical protein
MMLSNKTRMPGSSVLDSTALPSLGQAIELALVFAFIALVVFFNRLAAKRSRAGMAESRTKADALYRQTVVAAEEPRYSLRGDTAAVMKDEEAPYNDSGGEYALTRYARNADGEYFMLMFEVNQGVPKLVFAKLMEHHIARYVLQDKYREPPPNLL